jgi:hypothetical protein
MRPELIGPEFDVIPDKFLNKAKEEKDGTGNESKANQKHYICLSGFSGRIGPPEEGDR